MSTKLLRLTSIRTVLTLAVLILSSFGLNAQTVSGRITDPEGQAVIGASVFVTGTQNGTVSDENGNYALSNVNSSATLEFSCLGYSTVSVQVNGRAVINVVLEEENEMLEEMVVIGYGTVKKKDLTGAVSVVKPDDFKNKTNTSIGDVLQGAASGVSVRSTGEIGGTPNIQIRGTGNLTNNDPLYVIDGMPTNNDVNFNVNDIESIQVLKDASAAAIYGSRAANGVVIITTKSGSEGKTTFEFGTQIAVQNLKRLNLAKADEWKRLYDEAFDNAIAEGIEGVTKRMDHWDNDTDWQDAYFKTGVQQNYDFSMAGGSKTGKYRASFNYLNDSGTTINRRMERYTARVNSSSKLGVFTVGENISLGRTYIRNAGGGALRKVGGSIADVVRMIPTIPVYDENVLGGYGLGNEIHARALGANPVAQSNNRDRKQDVIFLRGTAFAEAAIFPWLKYKLNLGMDINDTMVNSWTSGYSVALNSASGSSSATASHNRNSTYLVENTLSFDKSFGKHNINALAGTTYQLTEYYTSSASQQGLVQTASGEFLTQVSTGTTSPSASGSSYKAALISYLGRINYDYDGKYLLSLTARIDGSSRFAKDYRWGSFPSVSAAWRISKENFFNVNWIDDLKIRANWGNLGSQNVGYYDYQMFINNYSQYLFDGGNGVITHGQTMEKLSNTNLTWERLEQINAGFDLAVLNNRLQVSAEYYKSTSHDVLTALTLLMTTGNGGGDPFVNAASISNSGIELTASWRDQISKDFSYSISANLSHSQNKLIDFGYGIKEKYTDYTTTRIGEPIGMFYMIQTDGIFQSMDEVNNYISPVTGKPIQPSAKPGDLRYIDAYKDGVINTNDRVVAGNPWPKLEAGLNVSMNYKKWDFSLVGFGKFGYDVFNFNRWYQEGFQDCNSAIAGYDYWREDNKGSKNPRLLYSDERNVYTYIDRWLEDGSFFKISSLSLGYTFDAKSLKRYFDSLHVSVSGQNLLTFTKYSGYDPDFQGSLFEPGMDFCSYPSPRSVIFSLNVKF